MMPGAVVLVRLLSDELSARVLDDLEASRPLVLSAISIFEVNQKVRVGKLDLHGFGPENIAALRRQSIDVVAARPEILALAASMTWRFRGRDHRDPIDRIVAAQALALDLPVATTDAAFDALDGLEVYRV